MVYDNIPAQLKAEKAWVNVWNNSKIPMQSNARKAASACNPETWSMYNHALQAVENEYYDGIGYVFHDTGIVGIDIDAGFEDGLLTKLAVDIISHCKSYTEKSRSGRGVHILLRGDIPCKGKNNGNGVEIYKTGRYFIMTGKVLLFSEIVENQSAIDYVLSTYFPDVVKATKTGYTGGFVGRVYSPSYPAPENGRVRLKPDYPPIKPGNRNLCLTSLAGQMHTQGYSKAAIYKELCYANQRACTPPLSTGEIESIVNSVTRYVR